MNPLAHLKAFAAETLSCLITLCLFFEVCYEPLGLMLEHGKCLRSMYYICSIIFGSGGDAAKHVKELWHLVCEHHKLFLACYGAALGNVKLHWMYHMVQCIERFGVCMDCFAGERGHKQTIALAMHNCSMGMTYGAHVCKRTLQEILGGFGSMTFTAFAFIGSTAVAPLELSAFLKSSFPGTSAGEVGNSARTPIGSLYKGDLVYLGRAAGEPRIGQVRFFLAGTYPLGGERPALVIFTLLRKVRSAVWGLPRDPNELHSCPVGDILATLPARSEADGSEVRPLLPWCAVV